MTRARKELIAVEDTPFYHCISRCVRRAYLCGDDFQTNQNFDHRKAWLVDRSKFLASVFSIDICAYAIMSNHYHLVLFINQDEVNAWSEDEVIARWGRLFPVAAKSQKNLMKLSKSKVDLAIHREKIEDWRANLANISWFMRCLNEYIARMANKEEGCTGRFWEGRFKSQALLDEKAVLSCMAYVDLNPIRATMAA
ncbi:MAG: transposase, partial [Gammaproteobacteria bacterium]